VDVELGRFLGQLGAAMDKYDERCNYWDRCDRSYEGFYKPKTGNQRASKWKSQYHPPYILQVIETIESFIVEGDPTFKVQALNPESEKTAPIMERLIRWQMQKDYFAEKQAAFVKQALIRGITVAKIAWVDERRMEPRRKFIPVMGDFPIDDPEGPEMVEVPYKQQPSFIPVDIKDFFWDPSATCIEDCQRVFFRSYSTLEQLEAQGIYDNLSKLADNKGGFASSYQQVDAQFLDDPDYRGKIEIIERWTPGTLTVVANRCEIIRTSKNPFWHGQIPFVVATTMPQPFKMMGKSEVEILADIQTMLWQFQNQRMDNVELINNAIVILQPSSVDDEQYEFYPGAIWKNRNPADVQMWTPNTAMAEISVHTEQMMKSDLETLSAALPYLSGGTGDAIDNKTATGISIVQNMAQKRLIRKKQQINWAYSRSGSMQVKLNQQLLPKSVSLRVDGQAEVQWDRITPAQIQGDYDFIVEDVSESLNRQERRAEALAKAQFFISNYPMLKQAGVNPNLNAVVEDVTSAFDEPPGKYVIAPDPAAALSQPQPPGGPGFPGLPGSPVDSGGAPAPGTPELPPGNNGAGAVPPPQFAAAMNGSQNGGGY
jgi:hypothetical protein